MPPLPTPAPPLLRHLDRAGLALYICLAGVVPLFFIPPGLAVLDTVASEIVFFKAVAARAVCATLFLLAALRLVLAGPGPWARVRLPTAMLLLIAGTSLLSALASPAPAYSVRFLTTELSLLAAVGLAPLFLRTLQHARAVAFASLASTLAAALVGLVAVSGHSDIYAVMYGADPIEVARQGLQGTMGRVEGSPMRAAMMSVFGNPEFSGTFLTTGFLLAFCWVMDGWGVGRLRTRTGWAIGVVAAGMLGIAILASQTRSALLAIAAGVLVRWLVTSPVRGGSIAGGLAAVLAAGLLAGFPAALVVFVAGLAAAAFWHLRSGALRPAWAAVPPRTKALLLLVPVGAVLLVAVGVVYDPAGLRLRELAGRLASATSTADFSARQRLIFYMMAGEMLVNHPLLGIGPGFFATEYHEALVRLVDSDATGLMKHLQIELGSWVAQQTHSDYFQIAAERGVLGLAAFLGLMTAVLQRLAALARGRSAAAPMAAALATALAGYLTVMLTSFPLLEAGRQAAFFGLLAASFGLLASAPENRGETGTE